MSEETQQIPQEDVEIKQEDIQQEQEGFILTEAEINRWMAGDFKPEDSKPIQHLIRSVMGLENHCAEQVAFYVTLIGHSISLLEEGKVTDVCKVLHTFKEAEARRFEGLINTRVGEDWQPKALHSVQNFFNHVLKAEEPEVTEEEPKAEVTPE